MMDADRWRYKSQRDCSPDQARAVMRRISTLDRPKLIGRHGGLARRPQVVSALPDMQVTQRVDTLSST
jgi:hypothetical protein